MAAHLFRLADIPSGLYLDESSIGYNAFLLAETGRDEHGALLPVYPKSVGDYKNPAFVYIAALFLKIFGVSEFSLRFVSVLFFFAALALSLLLVERLFQGNPVIRLYALVAFGFLPYFFTISRIAFEVIVQLTWTAAGLLLIWTVFHEEKSSKERVKAILCGFVLGTSAYTYSTGRLLAFLSLALLWVVYFAHPTRRHSERSEESPRLFKRPFPFANIQGQGDTKKDKLRKVSYFNRENIERLGIITISFVVSLIPFFYFTLHNPGAITSRFDTLSYLGKSIPLSEKVALFFQNYLVYFSPSFLIFDGDPNLRHSTGFGGVIFISVLLLSMIGLMSIIIRRKWTRFDIFLLASLFLSPVAAALTSEGTPHALRSMTLGVYIFFFSCHGMSEFIAIENRRARSLALTGISLLLLAEIALYQTDYFLAYPARSFKAMGSHGFQPSLQFAMDQNPAEIVFFSKPRETYANMQFYSLMVENPGNIPLTWDNRPKPDGNICIIYHLQNERELNSFPNPFEEFDSGGIIKARCYKP